MNKWRKALKALLWVVISVAEIGTICASDTAWYEKGKYRTLWILDGHEVGGVEVEGRLEKWGLQMVRPFQESGYPFAEVRFRIVRESGDTAFLQGVVNKGPYFDFDTVKFVGGMLSNGFARRVGGIRIGAPASVAKIKLLDLRLAALDFQVSDPEVLLKPKDGRLGLEVDRLKFPKDRLNGLVGVASNEQTGRILLTGELNGAFDNLLRTGHGFHFSWRSYKAMSQQLETEARLTYPFGFPGLVKLRFGLDKFDTSFTVRNTGVQCVLPMSKRISLQIGVERQTRVLGYFDSNWVKQTRALPVNAGSAQTWYQLGFQGRKIDQWQAPRRGWIWEIKAYAGVRDFKEDLRIAQVAWINSAGNTENVYDSLRRVNQYSTAQGKIEYKGEHWFPLAERAAWMVGARGFQLFRRNILFNELLRFGGVNSLRGFNEQSIFASAFHMVNLEIRQYLGAQSFVGAFFNAAYVENATGIGGPRYGWPYGFGARAGLTTGAGLLEITWAFGKEEGMPLSINRSRFHFGIGSRF